MLSFESMAISPATSYRRGQELHHDRRHAQLPAPQLYEEVESRIELQYTDARGTYVRGLTQVEVRSEQEALDQLFNGELQRTVAEHQLNKRSNRSHCVLTFHIA
ncbi:hypothetical protein PF011_g23705 [Phytophthora fragariae]|uniref:Kinesin motor domain-containing protein n=1 Tax=Phytophthora fragariae TaxID=53985 RepID=A0A6A3I6A1_9STRA|nr:hypothetical protein PF011_g23705 [Phytophthora fragariae]